jgi:hypothetical protein
MLVLADKTLHTTYRAGAQMGHDPFALEINIPKTNQSALGGRAAA